MKCKCARCGTEFEYIGLEEDDGTEVCACCHRDLELEE